MMSLDFSVGMLISPIKLGFSKLEPGSKNFKFEIKAQAQLIFESNQTLIESTQATHQPQALCPILKPIESGFLKPKPKPSLKIKPKSSSNLKPNPKPGLKLDRAQAES